MLLVLFPFQASCDGAEIKTLNDLWYLVSSSSQTFATTFQVFLAKLLSRCFLATFYSKTAKFKSRKKVEKALPAHGPRAQPLPCFLYLSADDETCCTLFGFILPYQFYARFMSDKNISMLNVILSGKYDVIGIRWKAGSEEMRASWRLNMNILPLLLVGCEDEHLDYLYSSQ